jgi:ribosomal protein S10
MADGKISRIRIRLSGYDPSVLELTQDRLMALLRDQGVRCSGPVPLPCVVSKFKVLRPQGGREAFEIRLHARAVDVLEPRKELFEKIALETWPPEIGRDYEAV